MSSYGVTLFFYLYGLYIQREADACIGFSLSLGYPDSNQERQDQNLQCYHYTIAQSFSGAKVRQVEKCAK